MTKENTEKKGKVKVRVGRPCEYKPEFAQRALEILYSGSAKIELTREFMVHIDTIHEWEKTIPEFSEAVRTGVNYSEAWWTKQGKKNLKTKDFNTRLYEINMMNRFGWQKKTEGKQEINITAHEDALKKLK